MLASGLYFSPQTAQIREGGGWEERGGQRTEERGRRRRRRVMEGAGWSSWRTVAASALIVLS